MASKSASKIPWARALDLKRVGNGDFIVDYPSDLCYKMRAHGGMLVSLVMRAVRTHFEGSPNRQNLRDVLDLKTHFLRMVTPGPMSIKIEDLSVGKRNATVEAKVRFSNPYHFCCLVIAFVLHLLNHVFLVNRVGNLSEVKGASFETNWKLDPPSQPAQPSQMANDSDPNWISWTSQWHAKSYARVMSHTKFFFPYRQDPDRSIRDQWMTPIDADPNFGWTNDLLGYVSDMTFSLLENYQYERGILSHENMIAMAKTQKRDCDTGQKTYRDPLNFSPFTSYTSSLNLDVKKKLPEEGVKWLFARTRSMLAKDGHMDWDITIHDETGDLVAVAYLIHQIIASSDNPQPGGTVGETGRPKM